ncbi:hypothetical protein N180_02855 [Pedobacter antarcticus 4BY]|uniref:DUF2971 domain-containing protein n=2 Tax=Pedobacter antarcticus TaxID=34086 RepID=A0A081PKI2_9SPHI|nr:DUF2971 domain-containing protein [Pedobacter antarcticus]KEQ31205.1 hypothetical protein N180_02855 [Pedobacter antarcticus 4BY]SFE54903.1 Protein of unknown function [Pedobacter antarcticus]
MPYQEHESVITIPDETVIWRYMNKEKFELLLESNSLWFCRSDKFKDEHEGSLTKKDYQDYNEYIKLNHQFSKPFLKDKGDQYKNLPKYFGISCWHINEIENDGLWSHYAENRNGVVIKSTVGRLKECITDEENVYIGKVSYLDYEEEKIEFDNYFRHFFSKRNNFSYENELRALVFKQPPRITFPDMSVGPDYTQETITKGLNIKCNLNTLVSAVYASPSANTEDLEDINNVIAKYGDKYNFTAMPSAMSSKPLR